MIPGFPLFAVTEFSPEWLTKQLQNIYGSALVGLWIGEDLVVDAQGNVTSWPGRVGPTLTRHASSNGQIPLKTNNQRRNGGITAIATAFTGSIINNVTSVGVVALTNNSISGYKCISRIVGEGYVLWIEGASNDTWRNSLVASYATTTYIDSFASNIRSSGIHIIDVVDNLSFATNPIIYVFNTPVVINTYQCTSEVSTLWVLSSRATPSQRIQTNYVLKKYYKIPISASEQLAYDLTQVFPTQILGLWIGDDYVVSGSNVTYLANRGASPNLTQNRTVPGTVTTVNGRQGLTYSSPTIASCYNGTLSAAWKSGWAVCEGPSALPATVQYNMINVGAANGECITINSGTSVLVSATGWTNYINGVTSVTPTSGSLQVIEGEKSANASTTFNRGYPGADLNWPAPGMFHMALNAIPTGPQRIKGVNTLKRYYSIPLTDQDILAEGLVDIYGSVLIGLWIGEDIVTDVTGTMTSWPGRTGVTLTRHASSTGNVNLTTIDGRTYIAPNTGSAIRFDGILSTNAFDVCCVAQTNASIAGYRTLYVTSLNANWIMGGPIDGFRPLTNMSFWQDGVAEDYTRTSGKHILESQKTTSTTVAILNFDTTSNVAYQCSADFAFLRLLSSGPSLTQRSAEVALLKSYYGIS